MAGKGPLKPTKPGLRLGTKTTESKPPTLTPKWGAAKSSLRSQEEPKKPPAKPLTAGHAHLGLSSERTRKRMVERLVSQGIKNLTVLSAMQGVARHRFVDEALASRAYEDSALPIGQQQTISQPYVVAKTIELALDALARSERPAGKALEVGAGCGYQAVVMARCFGKVVSVERIKPLYELAKTNLKSLRLTNLTLIYGDGLSAAADLAPFDAIFLSAGIAEVPKELLNQCAVGGVIVAPIGDQDQRLTVIRRTAEDSFEKERFEPVRYVPILRGVES